MALFSMLGLTGCAGTLPKLPQVAQTEETAALPRPASINGAQAGTNDAAAASKNESETSSSTTQSPSSEPSSSVASGSPKIEGFRSTSVVMYFSENGSHGERIAVSNLSLPMAIKYHSAGAKRFEVDMPSGSRWIDEKAVVIAGRPATGPSRR